jgi:hypothetical protein
MIVNHAYRFIFLKTRKTAGTSIEVALSPFSGPEDIVTPISPKDEALRPGNGPRNFRGAFNPFPELLVPGTDITRTLRDAIRGRKFFNHMTAAQAQNRLPRDIWNAYFKFCFVRNPWDRTVSLFHFENRGKERPRTWEEFLAHGEFRPDFGLYTVKGALAVDFVGRFEALEADLATALQKAGLPGELSLPRAKSDHRKDPRGYREYYTPAQRDLIAEVFAPEIEMFGYEF